MISSGHAIIPLCYYLIERSYKLIIFERFLVLFIFVLMKI